MIDPRCGVAPSENGALGAKTSEGDEALPLGDVDRLPVHAGGDADDSPASVADGDGVDGLLDGAEVTGAILRHCQNPRRRGFRRHGVGSPADSCRRVTGGGGRRR